VGWRVSCIVYAYTWWVLPQAGSGQWQPPGPGRSQPKLDDGHHGGPHGPDGCRGLAPPGVGQTLLAGSKWSPFDPGHARGSQHSVATVSESAVDILYPWKDVPRHFGVCPTLVGGHHPDWHHIGRPSTTAINNPAHLKGFTSPMVMAEVSARAFARFGT